MKSITNFIILLSSLYITNGRKCDNPPSGKYCLDSYPELISIVRVNYGGEWVPICADVWPKSDASIVCVYAYGSDAISAQTQAISDGVTQLARIDWECMANCKDCRNCITIISNKQCSSMAQVHCHDIRLIYQKDRRGMLEKYVDNEWGSICPMTWDTEEADVACNQLYSCPAQSALVQANWPFPASASQINVLSYVCYGNETSLDECMYWYAPDSTETCAGDDPRRAGVNCRSNCSRPVQADNIVLSPDRVDYEPSEEVKLTCAPGHRPESASETEQILTCYDNCRWGGSTLKCKPVCDPPEQVANATFSPQEEFYFVGQSVTYDCHQRYQMDGSPVRSCGEDQKWSPIAPECIENNKARKEKIGQDDTIGSFPAIVASMVMGVALVIAVLFFIVLVIRRVSIISFDYDESIDETSQEDDASQRDDSSLKDDSEIYLQEVNEFEQNT